MKLFDLDEIDIMLNSADLLECKDAESLQSCERFLTIVEACEGDMKQYMEGCAKARDIVSNKIRLYTQKTKTSWEDF